MRWRVAVLAALFFAAATLLFTWPIAGHLADGLADLWDARLNAWILHWDFHQTFRDPFHLFDANIFSPARDALAFSENLYGAAVFGFPFYAAGISTLTVYNVLFLLGMFLSALAAWALAREVTGDAAASLLAGLTYAFLPWRMAQIPHIQFQWGAFLALLLLFLLRYLDGGRGRDLALFGVCFAWNALSNVHYAIFSGILVAVVLLFELVSGPAAARRRVPRALAAVAIAGLAALPFLLPYVRAARFYGMERFYGEMEFFSGRWDSFLSAGAKNKLWGPITRRWSHPEGELFPGLLPLALAVSAVLSLRRRRPPKGGRVAEVSPARRRIARWLDWAVALLLLLWAASRLLPGLRIGPLKFGDSGRILVFASAALLARLVVAFPRRSPFANLGDFLRRARLDRKAQLFLVIAGTGVVLALGAHTPFYRFLFKSFGFIFRAIRAPSRAIVLFDLALAVLSAWGLSLLSVGRRGLARGALVSAALVLVAVEYRAFPLTVTPVEREAPPVDRWLAGLNLPGGVVEWPLGMDFDALYEIRSTAHWKPLVNGYSGFFPRDYQELQSLVRQDPIPDAVWEKVRQLGGSLLIFHPHDAPGGVLLRCGRAAMRGLALGRLEVLKTFSHGADTDYVFRITSAPAFDAGVPPEEKRRAAESFARLSLRPGVDLSRPFGAIDYPKPNLAVRTGEWGYGWALDDSGVREIRVSSEIGAAGVALLGGARLDVGKIFPGYPDASRCGFGFQIPALPPGQHMLTVTIVAKDGGQTAMRLPIRAR